ncbi:MFS transporter, partial [Kingella kingae]|nr:MFS transporter [Kingella kingae]
MKLYKPTKPLSHGHMAALLAMLITIMPFSIDAYLPALLDISTALNADIHHIEQSLSSFMLGIAIGQITGGSLSDIKGRRNIALVGLCIYLIGSFGLIFVQTADQLLTLRIVQALGAGMSAVVVGAVVRDNYQGREAAQMFALIGIIVMAAPL